MRCSTLDPEISSDVSLCQFSHFVCAFLSTFLCFCLSLYPSVCLPACLYVLSIQSMDSSDLSDGPITLQEYLEVKKALASSEAKVQQLMKVNNNLSEELRRLQKEVGSVVGGWKDGENKVRGVNVCRMLRNTEQERKQKVGVELIFYLFLILFNNSGEQQGTVKRDGMVQVGLDVAGYW